MNRKNRFAEKHADDFTLNVFKSTHNPNQKLQKLYFWNYLFMFRKCYLEVLLLKQLAKLTV